MSTNQPRKPAGTPSGGQWAPAQHAEIEDIGLSSPAAIAARRRANWGKLDSEHYYTDQFDDPRCYEIGPDGKPYVLGPEPKRYVLIEESIHDGRFWIGTFGTRAEAARYRDTEDNGNGWYIEKMIDLDTGREFRSEQTTRFIPVNNDY
jgi:hypothetical protein